MKYIKKSITYFTDERKKKKRTRIKEKIEIAKICDKYV